MQAKFLNEKKDKANEDYEFEKAREELTFQPNVLNSQRNFELLYLNNHDDSDYDGELNVTSATQNIKGYEMAMTRMKKGRELREKEKIMQTRGIPGTVTDESML
jgi:hypothetical protein